MSTLLDAKMPSLKDKHLAQEKAEKEKLEAAVAVKAEEAKKVESGVKKKK